MDHVRERYRVVDSTAVAYDDPTVYVAGQFSNAKIAETALRILQCPDDNTIKIGRGNLSYVVNGGFALWHASPLAWAGSPVDGGGKTGCSDDLVDAGGRPDQRHSEARCDVHGVDVPAGSGECTADSLEREVYL